jgi:hypothetical protein
MRIAPVILASVPVVAIAVVAATANAPAGEEAGVAPGYKMIAPLGVVMEITGEVFKRMPDRLKAGTDKDLKALKKESLFIAEIGNLAGHLDDRIAKKDWQGWAEALKRKGLSLAEAAGKKDAKSFEALYKETDGTCTACHDKYRD